MATASIQGANGQTIVLSYPSGENAAAAQFLAAQLNAEVASGKLTPYNLSSFSFPGSDNQGPGDRPSIRPQEHGGDNHHGGTPPAPLEVIIQSNGPAIVPKNAQAIVDAAQNSSVIGNGADNETFLAGSGNTTFLTNGGSGIVVTGDGTDKVVQTGQGGWNIMTGAGNDEVIITHGANTISPGTGHNTVLLLGGNNIVESTGSDTIQAATGSDTIFGGSKPEYVQGGDANLSFVGGSGQATVLGGTGSETVFGGGGGFYQGGTRGQNFIVGGDGATTIKGGGDGDQLYLTSSTSGAIYGGVGAETLNASASTGNNFLWAGRGNDLVLGGSGNDTLTSGAGSATLSGGAGKDTFEIVAGNHSHVTIADYSWLDGDVVNLSNYGSGEASYALDHSQLTGKGMVVSLSDGTKLTFNNVSNLNHISFTS